MSALGQLDKTHIEHNTSAVALIADMRADMDFRRSGPSSDQMIAREEIDSGRNYGARRMGRDLGHV